MRKIKLLKRTLERYERLIIPGMLISGLVVDFFTFSALNTRTAFVLLSIHVVLAGSIIAFVNIYDSRKYTKLKVLRLVSPFILQISFGALLSASLVFYWFSGAFSVSWPVILLFAIIIASNDVFRKVYLKATVQISVYFFALFSILTLMLPHIFRTIEPWAFILAGSISVFVIYVYVALLSKALIHVKQSAAKIIVICLCIFTAMNAFYFLNIIPPIPLAIRSAGAYHDLERVGNTYVLQEEKETVLQQILPGQHLHIEPGSRVYVFTSIFAPADLNTRIYHRWEYFNEERNEWVFWSRPSYSIVGGRDDGYRGYSFSSNVNSGRWRVTVETEGEKVLGRLHLNVEHVDETPELFETVK